MKTRIGLYFNEKTARYQLLHVEASSIPGKPILWTLDYKRMPLAKQIEQCMNDQLGQIPIVEA